MHLRFSIDFPLMLGGRKHIFQRLYSLRFSLASPLPLPPPDSPPPPPTPPNPPPSPPNPAPSPSYFFLFIIAYIKKILVKWKCAEKSDHICSRQTKPECKRGKDGEMLFIRTKFFPDETGGDFSERTCSRLNISDFCFS